MKRLYCILAVLLCITACQAKDKEIKTFSILGDSSSPFDGHIPEGNACWYFSTPQGDNDVTCVEQTWWHQFAKDSGLELILNESYSGSTICNSGYDGADYSDRAFTTRMFKVAEGKPDLIIVFGGTNDSWANSPIGELQFDRWSSKDMYSCLPSCCFMLNYLTTAAPDSEIVFLINSELKDEITAGIAEACDHYGVHWLLLKDIEKKWGHPSIKGMAQINEQLKAFLAERVCAK